MFGRVYGILGKNYRVLCFEIKFRLTSAGAAGRQPGLILYIVFHQVRAFTTHLHTTQWRKIGISQKHRMSIRINVKCTVFIHYTHRFSSAQNRHPTLWRRWVFDATALYRWLPVAWAGSCRCSLSANARGPFPRGECKTSGTNPATKTLHWQRIEQIFQCSIMQWWYHCTKIF